jgi:hypothetical protein
MHSLARLQYRLALSVVPDTGSLHIAILSQRINAVHNTVFPPLMPALRLSR